MAGIWPGETQCVITLGFDIDGVSSWIGRDPALADKPGLMSLAEYGPKRGVPRILRMLDDYDIKASFYVPGYVAETHEDMVRELVRRGHEVAHHGYMHEPLGHMEIEKETEILEKAIAILERITGEKPKGYRTPQFDSSTNTLALLASHGFVYDTSMHDDDVPYIHQIEGRRLVEIPVKWVLDDFGYFAFVPSADVKSAMQDPDSVFQVYAAEFEGAYRYGGVMTMTLHPQVSGRPSRLSALERLIKYARSHPNVAFMRGIDIAEYWLSRTGGPSTSSG
ncbi:MAG: polysaccharide deacetylase [Dehalococcoidia bacterium]